MVVVETLVSKLVKPTIPPPYPFSLLQISNLDLVIANIYVKTVYFFIKPTNGNPDFFSTHVLTHALSQALSHFYPIAGRLTLDMNIACNGAGALFVEALANCTIEELGDLKPDPKLLKLVPTLNESLDITSCPLLIIQVTTFKCGGVALGVGLEHHVADGASALSFLNTWSDIARGEASFTGLPACFDRVWLKARTPPTPQYVHNEYLRLPQPKEKMKKNTKVAKEPKSLINGGLGLGLIIEEPTNGVPKNLVNGGLGSGLITQGPTNGVLKSLVNGGLGSGLTTQEPTNGVPKSLVNGGLGSGLITQEPSNGVTKSLVNGGLGSELITQEPTGLGLGLDQEPTNGVPVDEISYGEEAVVRMFELPKDFLQKMKEKYCNCMVPSSTYEVLAAHVWRCCCEARNLPLEEETMLVMAVDGRARLRYPPKNYVGNVIFNCCPVLAAGEVLESVAETARKIQEALKGMDDGYCRSALDFLELQPDLSKFVKGAHTFACPNLGFISWAKFPMYECDFGWGRPVHVGLAHLAWEGHAYVLPPRSHDGSLRLCISLQRRHMQKFSDILRLFHHC